MRAPAYLAGVASGLALAVGIIALLLATDIDSERVDRWW